ncbi:MAG: hypothetical protein ABJB16_15520 [Saprospiraceae bacterium]
MNYYDYNDDDDYDDYHPNDDIWFCLDSDWVKEVFVLLRDGFFNVNAINHQGYSLLELAEHDEMISMLIEAGALVEQGNRFTQYHLPLARQICLKRIFQICVGLQSLELSALELLAIVDESNPNMAHLTMNQKWTAITAIKHFHEKKK